MPLDDAYQAGTDAALTDMVQRPKEPRKQEPRFSLWGTVRAPAKGTVAGTAEAIGSTADVLGAFGQALATTAPSSGGMFSLPSPDEQRQATEAADKLRGGGLDFMSEGGRSFRNVARDYMPDPATTHASEQAISELFRVGSKAIGAAALLGPVPGAVVSGMEEGFTASDKLAQQGVDLDTRTAVGLVTAAVQAGTFALPVAGKTWPQTIGLVLGGGPAGFVAQQGASRYILQQQDYSLLADQYDPLDPVGLTLSTVIPLGFGAIAMRAARGARTTEAQPAPGAPAAAPTPEIAPATVPPAMEEIDAARTALLSENVSTTRPVPAEDLTGSAAHEQAYERAIDQLAAGQRVDVADIAPAGEQIASKLSPKLAELARLVQEQDARLGRGEPVAIELRPDEVPTTATVPTLQEWLARNGLEAAQASDEAVAAARTGNPFVSWLREVGGVAFSEKFDIVGERGIRGNYAGIFRKAGQPLDTLVESAVQAGFLSRSDLENASDTGGTRALAEMIRRATTGEVIERLDVIEQRQQDMANRRAQDVGVEQMERELQALGVDPSPARGNPEALSRYLQENREDLVNARLAEVSDATADERRQIARDVGLDEKDIDQFTRIAMAQEIDEARVEQAAMEATDDVDFLNRIEDILRDGSESRKTAEGGQGAARDASVPGRAEAENTPSEPAAGQEVGGLRGESPELDARAALIEQQNPDLLVQLDGMDSPMPVRELMASLREELADDLQDVPLVQTAAECFLANL